MIIGHSFYNFQEKYQRAVKIARALDEIDWENQATNLGKRQIEYDNPRPKSGNPKRFNTGAPKGKRKQPIP